MEETFLISQQKGIKEQMIKFGKLRQGNEVIPQHDVYWITFISRKMRVIDISE